MKSKTSNERTMTARQPLPPCGLFLAAMVLVLASTPASAGDGREKNDDYQQLNLVPDLPGIARLQDTNLVNARGMSFSTTSPFWISDNGSGLATLYAVTNDMNGVVHVVKQGLQVTIPGDGTPSGQLFNGTTAFHTDLFIFASEDGTISGWRDQLALGPGARARQLRRACGPTARRQLRKRDDHVV
jgi:hypothetical protein